MLMQQLFILSQRDCVQNLMTALGAIIALLPIALGIGTGAQLHQPLAIAVIGGFIAAMPLLLIVLPSLIRLRYSKSAKIVRSFFLESTVVLVASSLRRTLIQLNIN
jgi:hypothetical protein